MALHTVVFLGTAGPDFAQLNGVSDGVFGLLGVGLIPPQQTRLVAAVAGGPTIEALRLEQRSMDITPANIRPINTFPWPSPVGAMSDPAHAPVLPGGEAVQASAQGSGSAVAVCWFADQIEPVPQGQSFLLAFQCLMNFTASTLNTWVRTEFSWDVPYLPAGRYQILGMEVYAKDTVPVDVIAARLVLPNQVQRPGALVLASAATSAASAKLPPSFQMDGSLGCWGWFEQGSPPKLEVIARSEGGVPLRGTLRVVKATGSAGGMTTGGSPTWG